MKASLRIEAIGDDALQHRRLWTGVMNELVPGMGDAVMGKFPASYWVAEITGTDPTYKWRREFIKGKKDYGGANSVGSRGIFIHYILESGKVYEVKARTSWRSSDRYFCRVDDAGNIVRMAETEVQAWLKDRSE